MEVASSIAAIRVAQRTDGYIHTHTNLNTPMQTLLRTHAWTQTNTQLLALGMYCIVFSFSMINEAEAIHKKAKNKRSLSLITLPATIKLPSPTIVQTDERFSLRSSRVVVSGLLAGRKLCNGARSLTGMLLQKCHLHHWTTSK